MLDRGTVREVMREVEEAVKAIIGRHGLEWHKQRASFTAGEMTTKITLRTAGAVEAQADFQRMQFPVLAARLGLPEDAIGRSFTYRGSRYTIEGLKIERPKFPVSCRRIDGKGFKFPVNIVKVKLEALEMNG